MPHDREVMGSNPARYTTDFAIKIALAVQLVAIKLDTV